VSLPKEDIETMNKTDLVNNIAEKSGLSKKDVEAVLNGFLGEVTDALASGEKVQLIGFGTFETRKRSGRTGRNPQTGKEITIPESNVPAFKAGNKLKDAVK
jgi:DNA-binding protein HU-beta